PVVVFFPRQCPLLGREQSSLLRKDHPRKPPPVGNDLSVGIIAEVIAVLCCKLVSPLCGQIVEPVVVFLGETVVVEVVQGIGPNGPADRVELPVNVVVGPPEVMSLQLCRVGSNSD